MRNNGITSPVTGHLLTEQNDTVPIDAEHAEESKRIRFRFVPLPLLFAVRCLFARVCVIFLANRVDPESYHRSNYFASSPYFLLLVSFVSTRTSPSYDTCKFDAKRRKKGTERFRAHEKRNINGNVGRSRWRSASTILNTGSKWCFVRHALHFNVTDR